ncbi:branched-chain amino acid ABC transporter permease [Neorhizobium galegae]|uniref:branched-chain amino acid ABC transporter permease n=1 Tax=Neorhizobium galegae TaxID=399 RepID=UPI001354C05F|nr:branched-chain amino acid ABC transporter permease [Neorhizobium galegae]KAB1115061.1 branched-chain amino acid ABC transporter permease [Neorhizobium galegae]MCQ1774388.1 branched-chain amino acid ABC transporter permease [Neorhizobium galegae]MCQ1798954.1 branched-chain amino acid ABC transporter permease [Neorhizobium galegae]
MEIYIISISVVAGIYAIMALGLNVMWGMAGLVNLGLVGSAAVGAYTSAILTGKLGLPIGAGILCGTIAAAAVGAGLSLVTRRLKDNYLAIVTLGFAETIRIIASNEIWLTNGTDGISGIAGPFRTDVSLLQFNVIYLGIVVLVLAALYVCCQRILYSPFGRVLRAVRDDDVVVSVAGKNSQVFKVQAFAIGSGIVGLAGGLYAHYTSFISPDLFVPLLTLYVKLSLLVGGVGNNRGAVVGATLIILILEGTRFVIPFIPYITPPQGAAMRELFLSATLLIVLRFRVTGLIPEAQDHPVVARDKTADRARPTTAS